MLPFAQIRILLVTLKNSRTPDTYEAYCQKRTQLHTSRILLCDCYLGRNARKACQHQSNRYTALIAD